MERIPEDLPAAVAQIVRNRFRYIPDALREDIEGAALLAALRACRAHQPGSGSLGGFIRSAVEFAAQNAYRDLTREERRFKPMPLDTPIAEGGGLTVADTVADPHACPERSVLHRDWERSLWAAVESLEGPERDVLTLTYGEGLTQGEAAARFGMSRAWVNKQHRRALAALRERLQGEAVFSGAAV